VFWIVTGWSSQISACGGMFTVRVVMLEIFTLNRPKRQIRSVKFTDCVAQNIVNQNSSMWKRQKILSILGFILPVTSSNRYLIWSWICWHYCELKQTTGEHSMRKDSWVLQRSTPDPLLI
jgi:hypothetical protein